MKKITIFLLLFLTSFVYSQNLITKDKEAQIKKNLTDYRILIIEHKKTVKENSDLKTKIEDLNKEIEALNQKIKDCSNQPLPKKSKIKIFIEKLFPSKHV